MLTACRTQGTSQQQARLSRAESFFGIHFDFHAGMDCTNIGARTTPEMVENIISLVNLVNAGGPHSTQSIIETIPPVGPLNVTIRLARKPAKITLEPAGLPLPFKYADGKVRLAVPQVAIHDIIVVEPR
jgi:hypothetical protein